MAAETASGLAATHAPAGPDAAGIRAQAGAVARRSVTRTLRQRRLLFLAPVYVPVGPLTGWIHDIARTNPATPVLEAGRGLLAGTPADLALSFSLLAAGIAVTGTWALRGLSSAERAG
jgi:hypothetical protein